MAPDFSGLNIDEIPGNRIKEELLKIVKSQLKSDDCAICIEPGSNKGENFMGEIYRVLYKKSDENYEENIKSLILKIATQNRTQQEMIRKMFLREAFMYEQVLPLFNELLLSKGLDPKEDGFIECPKCFGSIVDSPSESIFLEDLKLRQFEMIDIRTESLTFEHVSLLMKALGKLHAMSFVLRDQQPDKLNQLKEQCFELFLTTDFPIANNWRNIFYARIMDCLEEEKRYDLIEKLERFKGSDLNESICNYVSGASAEPFAVISHGDLTTNNSMFRKDEQGKAVEIQLFDWQCSRYASPVIELVVYLLCSTTKELRDKHYNDFLKIYHESLSSLMSRLGSDPQKLFPFEALLDQFRQFGAFATIVVALLLPVLYGDRNTMPGSDGEKDKDLNGVFLIPENFKKAYNKIIIDILDDMVRFDYI